MTENKKVLFIIGMEYNPEQLMKKKSKEMNPENILIFQSYGPITAPFSDLMRDIIIAVYEENVEEIYVDISKKQNYKSTILKKICQNKGVQEKIQVYEYLFKYCMPEFAVDNINDWLEGSNMLTNGKDTIQMIRDHPLLPSHIKVAELA